MVTTRLSDAARYGLKPGDVRRMAGTMMAGEEVGDFALVAILFLLQTAFGDARLALLTFMALPMALVGGVLAAFCTGAVLSPGSLVGLSFHRLRRRGDSGPLRVEVQSLTDRCTRGSRVQPLRGSVRWPIWSRWTATPSPCRWKHVPGAEQVAV